MGTERPGQDYVATRMKDEDGLDHTWGNNRRDDKSSLILNVF